MNELSKRVEAISDQNVFSCNQCGNCSAGCMFTDEMSVLPHQVMALIQRAEGNAMEANTPWICASCFVCSVRCPRGIDVAAVMEALREIKIRERGFRKIDLREIERVRDLPQIAITAVAQKFTW